MPKKLPTLLAAAVIITSIPLLPVSAETSAQLSYDSYIAVGEQFVLTVKITSDEDIGYIQAQLEYDDAALEYITGDGVGGGGLLSLQGFPTDDRGEITLTLEFEPISSGYTSFELINAGVYSVDGTMLGAPSSTEVFEVMPAEENDTSSEADDESPLAEEDTNDSSTDSDTGPDDETPVPTHGILIGLTADSGILQPAFSYDTYEYQLIVTAETESLSLYAAPASNEDTVTVTGSEALNFGSNIRTVTVEGADGSKSVYTVDVLRPEPEQVIVTETQPQSQEETVSESEDFSVADTPASSVQEEDDLKAKLNLALAITLTVLVVALAILLMWLFGKGKSKNKRSKKRKKRK